MAVMSVEVTRSTPYNELPQLLSVREAAAISGRTTWWVYQNIHQGNIPYRRMGPKIILIPKEYFDPSRAQAQVTP